MRHIDGVAVPPNEGNLPLDIERDHDPESPTFGRVLGIRIAWQGFSIREQIPWTRSVGER